MRPRPAWQHDPDPYVRHGNDIVEPATRSRMLGAVRSAGNRSTELAMMDRLAEAGLLDGCIRQARFPGRPDFAWPEIKVALFVDGCFWHGCPRHGTIPMSNSDFWHRKFRQNEARDRRADRRLRALGWSVLRVWECRVAEPRTIIRITRKIESRRAARGEGGVNEWRLKPNTLSGSTA